MFGVGLALGCLVAAFAAALASSERADRDGAIVTCGATILCAALLPPLGYLARWRIHLACKALRDQRLPVASVAALAGYSSQGAFSNAFKRMTGVSPSLWRERQACADAA